MNYIVLGGEGFLASINKGVGPQMIGKCYRCQTQIAEGERYHQTGSPEEKFHSSCWTEEEVDFASPYFVDRKSIRDMTGEDVPEGFMPKGWFDEED